MWWTVLILSRAVKINCVGSTARCVQIFAAKNAVIRHYCISLTLVHMQLENVVGIEVCINL